MERDRNGLYAENSVSNLFASEELDAPEEQTIPDTVYAGLAVGFLISRDTQPLLKELKISPLESEISDGVLDRMGEWERPKVISPEMLRFHAFTRLGEICDLPEEDLQEWKSNQPNEIQEFFEIVQDIKTDKNAWTGIMNTLKRDANYLPPEKRGRKNH